MASFAERLKTLEMKSLAIYGCLLASLALFSCKKENNTDNDNNPPVVNDNCRLVKTSRVNFQDKIFEYDAQERLAKVKVGNSIRTFIYNGNTVKVEVSEDNGQSIHNTRTITLNNDKLATNVRTEFTAGHWENTAYEYEGTRVVKRIYTHFIATNPSVTTYEWENGNMVRETSPSGTVTTYTYDANEIFQPSDYFGLRYYEYGIRTLVTKNRIKKIVTGNNSSEVIHFENADGKVTGYKIDLTPGGDYTVNFTYECD